MPDFTVLFPLEFSNVGIGFEPINQENLNRMVTFNLKMIILTEPGERIMFPNFGVGVRKFLFNQAPEDLGDLNGRIRRQVRRFAPYVNILDLSIEAQDNSMSIILKYEVPKTTISDILQLDIVL